MFVTIPYHEKDKRRERKKEKMFKVATSFCLPCQDNSVVQSSLKKLEIGEIYLKKS
jgi:hypothetical protein